MTPGALLILEGCVGGTADRLTTHCWEPSSQVLHTTLRRGSACDVWVHVRHTLCLSTPQNLMHKADQAGRAQVRDLAHVYKQETHTRLVGMCKQTERSRACHGLVSSSPVLNRHYFLTPRGHSCVPTALSDCCGQLDKESERLPNLSLVSDVTSSARAH